MVNGIKPDEQKDRNPRIGLTDKEVRAFGVNPEVYVHCENTQQLWKMPLSELPISSCLPGKQKLGPILESAVRTANIRDSWAVLPAYLVEGGNFNDFQLTISGSMKPKESSDQGAKRESSEEIGLDFVDPPLVTGFIRGGKSINVSVYKPSHLRQPMPQAIDTRGDDKSNKVATWLLIDDPYQVIGRQRVASKDKAGKVVVVMKFADVIRLIKCLKWP